MQKTLNDYRTYIRTYIDVDATEMPDLLVDSWIFEADVRLYEATKRWPFYEAETTLNVTSGVHTYTIPVASVKDVQNVYSEDGVLRPLGVSEAVRYYEPWGSATVQSGRPQSYTLRGGKIRIWPTPDATYALTVQGYRPRTDWLSQGAGAVPDFPREFEPALLAWLTFRAYMHQDDPEMADRERERFEELFQRLLATEGQAPPQEVVVGGAPEGRLLYPIPTQARYDAWWG